MTWDGTATFSPLQGKALSSSSNRVVWDMPPDVPTMIVSMSGSGRAGNIHIGRQYQEQALKAGEIFTPEFLAKVKPWSALRFMDRGTTNGNQISSRASGVPPTYANFDGGVPIETMVDAANAAGRDTWYNVPAHADDDYIRRAVTLIRDRLSTQAKLHLEYSNKVWNWGYEQAGYARDQGKPPRASRLTRRTSPRSVIARRRCR